MPLSAAGYNAAGAGMTTANGNYVPVTGANATWNGATQYTNGTDFLSFVPNPGGFTWSVANAVNTTYAAGQTLYTVASTASGTTNMPLTGWTTNAGATAPAPMFTVLSAAPAISRIRPRVVVF